MLSRNPQAVKRRKTMMCNLGWDGSKGTYQEYLRKYRLYMAGSASVGGKVRVPKGFAISSHPRNRKGLREKQ